LLAAGYQIYAVNPKSAERYRDRHSVAGAKSDRGDAKVLADLVRTDRHNHRLIAQDSEQVEAIQVLARAHKELVWARRRHANQLRSTLREFFPGALEAFDGDLAGRDALAILSYAPTPERARSIRPAKMISALRQGGRERNLEPIAARLLEILRRPQLEQPAAVARAHGLVVASQVSTLRQLNQQLAELEQQLRPAFEDHPDAEIYLSLPGLHVVLGARVLSEFGDDPTRFSHPRERKSYAGTAPVTKASGKSKIVIFRFACNHHLRDALFMWAFIAINTSPGARRYYDQLRARHKTHTQALLALGNRLVGILHGCLRRRQLYDETIAWPLPLQEAA
jgi:transposase